MLRRPILGLAAALCLLVQGSAIAADDTPAPDSLSFVQGDDVWVPGWVFNNSDDWLALSCTEQACQLVTAALQVTPASWQGQHDDLATSGQQLGFSKAIDTPGEVYAWIRQDDSLPWLRPGAIELYYASGLTPIVQDREDTYEMVIATSGGNSENLGPVLHLGETSREGSSQSIAGSPVYLRLKARGTQQLLSEQMAACSGQLSLEYLLWSGDLDRDGKTDYLVDYTDSAMGSVKLYLSSYAKPDQLVGEAGVGTTRPLDGDCA